MPRALPLALPVALLAVLPAVPALDESAPSKAEEALVNKVLRKLLAEMEAPSGLDWPPRLVLEAADRPTAGSDVVRTPQGKNRPRITLNAALPRLVHGDEDVLAFVLGHELGHLALGHYRLAAADDANERREFEADGQAAELLLRAGYSLRKAARGLVRQKEMPSSHLSPASRKSASRSWDERFARLRSAPTLWKTLRAFENGVLLLALEQYEAAEVCFTRAADEFPGCHEAWANLGIACLMQYADGFTTECLREEGIGQLVCGSFYRRSPLVRVIGGEKLWWRAVGSLREALRLRPEGARVKAYLGLAYLLHPGGKDVGEAARYLAEAVAAGQAIEDVLERLGKHRTAVVLPRTNLKRYQFEQDGVDVLATEEVMAVLLREPKAPPVKVRDRGPGGAVVAELRVGMTRRQVERLLGEEDALDRGGGYFLYRALGVAVRYDGTAAGARVVEMAVARPPEDGPLGR